MNIILKQLLVIAFILSSIFTAHATIGCQETSSHMDDNGYDYKTLKFVRCSCPCERYRAYDGRCGMCGHYPEHHTF